MKKQKTVTKKCPHCGKLYKLGFNGVVGGCDDCMYQRRDRDGNRWSKWESTQDRMDIGSDEVYTVKWDDVKP